MNLTWILFYDMYTIVMYCNNIFVANNQNNIFCIIFVNNWRNFLFYAVLRVVFSLIKLDEIWSCTNAKRSVDGREKLLTWRPAPARNASLISFDLKTSKYLTLFLERKASSEATARRSISSSKRSDPYIFASTAIAWGFSFWT